MYKIFKAQLEKSKLIITGIRRYQRLGHTSCADESIIMKMEEDCKHLEALSAELEKMKEEMRKKSMEADAVMKMLKKHTLLVKKSIKNKYDQTWWYKFGIPDKR